MFLHHQSTPNVAVLAFHCSHSCSIALGTFSLSLWVIFSLLLHLYIAPIIIIYLLISFDMKPTIEKRFFWLRYIFRTIIYMILLI